MNAYMLLWLGSGLLVGLATGVMVMGILVSDRVLELEAELDKYIGGRVS